MSPAENSPTALAAPRWRGLVRFAGPAVGLGLFVLALRVLGRELRGERLRDVLAQLGAIPTSQVALALLLTAASFVALTGYDAVSVRYARRRLSYRRIALASFINYAFTQSLGFPLVTGGAVRYRLYSGWGLSAPQVTRLVAFASFSFWLGVLAVGGLVFVRAAPADAAAIRLSPAAAHLLGVAALAVVAAYLWWTVAGRRSLRVRDWRLRRPRPRLALAQLGVAGVDWLLASSVLYVLLPADVQVTYAAFLAIFVIAFVAGVVSNVPAGLGVFEGVVLLLLPDSVSEAGVVASLAAYRVVYNLLPLVAAALCLGVHEALRRRTAVGRVAGAFGRWVPALAPGVFAATTFAGGVILLVSGATPGTTGRLRWMDDVLPLPIIEASHFLAGVAGMGLLLLAAGLQRRLDAAYHLTVALLAAGVVLSLAKGLDYEEAFALGVMLAAIVPARRHFYRRASLWAEPFTPGWTVAVLAVLLGTAWLGFFSYKNVDYTKELWWRFAWSADAPRSLRAMVGASAVALFVAGRRLLRPAAPEPARPTDEELERAAAVAARSRDTMAHAALFGDKALLFSHAGDAFLMYAVAGRSWVALGDPVGPPVECEELLWRFRELVDRHGGWPVFYLLSAENLSRYVDHGLTLFKLGEEAHVPLPEFSLDGRGRKGMRRVLNACRKDGVTFEVADAEAVGRLLPEMRAVSDAWMAERRTREKGFSIGSFREEYLRRYPAAIVRQRGRLVAFANVWPGAERHELSVDLMRYDPTDAPADVMEFLLVELMLWGKAEGYRWFNLGMAPLSGLDGRRRAPLWNRVGALVFRLGEHFYSFQGLRRYKAQFDPIWRPRYVATPGGFVLPRVITDIATLVSGGLRGVVDK